MPKKPETIIEEAVRALLVETMDNPRVMLWPTPNSPQHIVLAPNANGTLELLRALQRDARNQLATKNPLPFDAEIMMTKAFNKIHDAITTASRERRFK